MKSFSEERKDMLRNYLLSKKLSKCEAEVVILVIQGLINKEVASKLCVAEKTVKFHLTNVYKKLNISRRSQLVWTLPLFDFVGSPEPPMIRRSPERVIRRHGHTLKKSASESSDGSGTEELSKPDHQTNFDEQQPSPE